MNRLGEEAFEFGPRLVQGGGDGSSADGQVLGYLVVRQLIEKTKAADRALALRQLGDGLAKAVGQLPAHGVGFRIAVRAKEAEAVQGHGRLALPQSIQGPKSRQTPQERGPAADMNTDALNFQENVLNHVLSVGSMAQDAPGRGEHHRPVLAHDPFPISGLAQFAQATVPGIGHR
jgi:hypothetical protein